MTSNDLDRRLLAILAADVVGYSRLMEADEAGTIARLKAVRAELVDPLVAKHHGHIVKLMGDGALVTFNSVVDAVACSAGIQTEVAARNAGLPQSEQIVFRIGVNLGDVALVDGDLYGDGVNIAARLEQLCEPGSVLVSGTAYDHLQGKLGLPLDFVGEQQVKNISRPVRTYRLRLNGKRMRPLLGRTVPHWTMLLAAALLAVIVATGAVWWFQPVAAVSANASIAVLPFNNYGGDEASGRLADGLTEDIITDLARFPELAVIARNSTEIYKGKAVDVRQVGKDLGVGFVLEGSIQRQGDQVRINAQLIDSKTGNHVWSERWDRPAEDIFAVQTEIAGQVTNRMGGGAGLIQTAGREAARRKRPDNLTAYELYLLGTEKLEQMSAADIAEAVRLLTRAVELDPGLARAWVELSHAYGQRSELEGADLESDWKLADEAAERAVSLDPSDAEAHVVLGSKFGYRGDFVRAKAEFDTALRLAPGAAEILIYYSSWTATFGEPKRGGEMADQAIKLDPNYPLWAAGQFAYTYFAADRYEDSLRMLTRLSPDNYNRFQSMMRAGSLAALGRVEEAKTWVKEALKRYPDMTIEAFANEPAFSDAEYQRFINTMRLAGFPACAKPEALAKIAKPVRLSECATASDSAE